MKTNFNNFSNEIKPDSYWGKNYVGDPTRPNIWKGVEFNDGDKVEFHDEPGIYTFTTKQKYPNCSDGESHAVFIVIDENGKEDSIHLSHLKKIEEKNENEI